MAAIGGAEIGGSAMTINVLGTDYTIELRKTADDPKLENVNGYCEPYSKKIIVEDVQPEVDTVERLDLFKCRVLRHEIVHAFLFESGLAQNSDWARNEEMVDWIAFQLPKLEKVMREVGAFDAEPS